MLIIRKMIEEIVEKLQEVSVTVAERCLAEEASLKSQMKEHTLLDVCEMIETLREVSHTRGQSLWEIEAVQKGLKDVLAACQKSMETFSGGRGVKGEDTLGALHAVWCQLCHFQLISKSMPDCQKVWQEIIQGKEKCFKEVPLLDKLFISEVVDAQCLQPQDPFVATVFSEIGSIGDCGNSTVLLSKSLKKWNSMDSPKGITTLSRESCDQKCDDHQPEDQASIDKAYAIENTSENPWRNRIIEQDFTVSPLAIRELWVSFREEKIINNAVTPSQEQKGREVNKERQRGNEVDKPSQLRLITLFVEEESKGKKTLSINYSSSDSDSDSLNLQ